MSLVKPDALTEDPSDPFSRTFVSFGNAARTTNVVDSARCHYEHRKMAQHAAMPVFKVAVVLSVGLFVFLAAPAGDESWKTEAVPNLIGKDVVAAQQLLARRGLDMRWGACDKPHPLAFVVPDSVYAQWPPPGERVPRGTVVSLVPGSSKVLTVNPPLCG